MAHTFTTEANDAFEMKVHDDIFVEVFIQPGISCPRINASLYVTQKYSPHRVLNPRFHLIQTLSFRSDSMGMPQNLIDFVGAYFRKYIYPFRPGIPMPDGTEDYLRLIRLSSDGTPLLTVFTEWTPKEIDERIPATVIVSPATVAAASTSATTAATVSPATATTVAATATTVAATATTVAPENLSLKDIKASFEKKRDDALDQLFDLLTIRTLMAEIKRREKRIAELKAELLL